ncbi:MAG TPA: carboxylate--amine ligase [Acidimicrobiaceae bacterium]|nr:carboxylate--amine ligase [Acidimicrobiaceae bacterium]
MDELRWSAEDLVAEQLDRPVLVVAFHGLFDAAGSATSAVEWLAERLGSVEVGDVDPETFFDFTQQRPIVEFDDGGERRIRWAENRILAVRTPDGQPDLVLLSGVEPHLRWRTFSETILEATERTGSRLVTTLGSMSGMAPHTRPPAVTASCANREMANRLGLDGPSYTGPTGVVGVLHDTLDRAGVPIISLRVSVPYYLPDSPNPKATRSLLRRLEQVTGIETYFADLDGPSAEWQARVDEAVAENEEVRSHVRRLEEQVDQTEALLPKGDDLAAELEAFLRDQGQSPPSDW